MRTNPFKKYAPASYLSARHAMSTRSPRHADVQWSSIPVKPLIVIKKKGFIIRPVVATIGPNHNRNKTAEARTRQGSCCQREDHDGQRRVGRLDLTNTGQNISSVFVRRQGGEQSTASDFLSNHHHTQPSPRFCRAATNSTAHQFFMILPDESPNGGIGLVNET